MPQGRKSHREMTDSCMEKLVEAYRRKMNFENPVPSSAISLNSKSTVDASVNNQIDAQTCLGKLPVSQNLHSIESDPILARITSRKRAQPPQPSLPKDLTAIQPILNFAAPIEPFDEYEETIQIIADVRTESGSEYRSLADDISLAQLHLPHISDLTVATISRDLDKLIIGKENSEIWLWDLDLTDDLQYYSKRAINHWRRTPVKKLVDQVEFRFNRMNLQRNSDFVPEYDSDDEVQLISGPEQRSASTLTSSNTKLPPTILRGHSGPVYSLSLHEPTSRLLSSSSDSSIAAWDLHSGVQVATYLGHECPIWSVEVQGGRNSGVSGDFASGDREGLACLWSFDRSTSLRSLPGHHLDVNAVCWHPGGSLLGTASSDRTVRLWDVHRSATVRLFTGHQTAVHSLAFSNDGKYLLTGSESGEVKLWDLASGSLFATLGRLDWFGRGEKSTVHPRVTQVRFSENDQQILATGPGMAGVWVWRNPFSEAPLHSSLREPELVCLQSDLASCSMAYARHISENLVLALSRPRSQGHPPARPTSANSKKRKKTSQGPTNGHATLVDESSSSSPGPNSSSRSSTSSSGPSSRQSFKVPTVPTGSSAPAVVLGKQSAAAFAALFKPGQRLVLKRKGP